MTTDALSCAQKAIASTLRKEEKALATMTAKNARQWQLDKLAADIRCHRTILDLLEGRATEAETLNEALAAIPGYIANIQKILPKFAPGTPQHTLAARRIAAYQTAVILSKAKNPPVLPPEERDSALRAKEKARLFPTPHP